MPLRITFILAAADLSGGNRVISIYAKRLQQRGHHVTIISRPRRHITMKEKLRALLQRRPIPVNRRHWPSHFDGLDVEHRQIDACRPIVAGDVPDGDVVIATWWETAEWVAALPLEKGAKAYFIQHYETHAGQDIARVQATWRLPLHKIIIAQWLAKIAADTYGDNDISLVPNAVDLEQFHAPPRGKQLVPTVGVMYSVVPFKGCDIAIKAFDLARRRVPNLRLISFGNRAVANHLPLPDGAEYTMQPPQETIREIYARCDAWLFASRSEGFGLPILEAMACRTPVIATPAGAVPELVAPGGGVLVPAEDPAAMADVIERVAMMAERDWRETSERAHAAAAGYTWDNATERFETALHQTIGREEKAKPPIR